MWILSQNEKDLIKVNQVSAVNDKVLVLVDTEENTKAWVEIGLYDTCERAKEVILDMLEYTEYNSCVYKMPR